jgi:opacity protein-like surface antigen
MEIKMKKNRYIILLMAFLFTASFLYAQESYQKLAQTGCQFLSVGIDARSTAVAEAFTSVEAGSQSLFYNPAGMARMNNYLDLTASTLTYIADIKYYGASLSINPFGIQYGILGFSFTSVDYGELQGTIVDPDPLNEKGYLKTDMFKPSALAAGVGYAIQLSDRFSVGLQVKYIQQSLGSNLLDDEITVDNKVSVIAFDFGTLYQTGIKSLAFGMSVRNFSQELRYQSEGFQLPLTFKLGISMNAMDLIDPEQDIHSLLVALDAVHNRDYPEQINFGFDYTFNNLFSVRAGYMFNNDEHGFTAGFGVQQFGLGIDYGYTPFGIFDDVHRITVRYSY